MKESQHPKDAVAVPDAQYDQPSDKVNNHMHVSCNFYTVSIDLQSYRLIIKMNNAGTQRSMHFWIRLCLGQQKAMHIILAYVPRPMR